MLGLCFLAACSPQAKTPFGKQIRCLNTLMSHQNWVEFSADGETERYACLGYLQAKHRSWQMDFLRRKFRGTTAEELGTKGIRSDFQMRLLGLSEHAERIATEISPETRTKLEAFSYGVTQGFKKFSKDSYEFKRLGTRPDAWTVADTIGILLLQAFDQTRKGLSQDMKEQSLDPKWITLGERPLPFDTSILKKGEYPKSDILRRHAANLLFDGEPTGSNNWVLSAKRSESGNTLLANDPHLALVHPSFWLPFFFRSEKQDQIFGSTVPGTPVFASGVNSTLSWGLTNSYFDSMDAVAVKKDLIPMKQHRPVIWFRFGFLKVPFLFKTFDRLVTGEPVMPIDTGNPDLLYVIRWSGFELHGSDIDQLVGIETSKNVSEFDARLSGVGLPSWNFVYADTAKQIGFRANGKLPRRASQLYGVEEVKSEKELKWFYLSEKETPHVLSPSRGYIATANHTQWPSDAKFSAGRAHALPTRGFRIEEMILDKKKWKLHDLKNIQCDRQAVDARFILDLLLTKLESEKTEWSEDEKTAKTALEKWDFETRGDCAACAVYRVWVENLLPQAAKETSLFMKAILYAPAVITVKNEFEEAVKRVTKITKSPTPAWNTFHFAQFPHFSEEKQIDPIGLVPTEGDNHSVNVGSSDWNEKYWLQNYGASLRMLVEMSSPPKILFKLAGSVVDFDRPELIKKDSPWMRWSECQYDEVMWNSPAPIQWSEEEWI